MKRFKTSFLTPDSSFLTGAGTIFNLAGCYYRFDSSRTAAAADNKALFMDWAMTGQDLKDALAKFVPEDEKQTKFPFTE